MTTQLLEKMGHETHTVTDGMEALTAVREQPYVVALTASVMEEDRKRCREAGMDAFLSKPIQREDLADVLDPGRPPRQRAAVFVLVR
jgi:CheY-like chemotaxis protein